MADKTTGKLKLWLAKTSDKISDTINIYLSENFTKIDTEFSNLKDEVESQNDALTSHKAAAAPHSGHETPAGAQAKADAAEARAKAYTDQEVTEVSQALDVHLNDKNNPHNITKQQVGLGNVDNVQQIPLSQKGQPNGVATLDDMGKVPSSQLPDSAASVTSVNGKTGIVVLTAPDVGAETPAGAQAKAEAAAEVVQAELDSHLSAIATQEQLGHVKAGQNITIDPDGTINAKGGNVDSINGKTGEVVIDVDDIAGLVNTRLALGQNASAINYSIALGNGASATRNYSIALGHNASAAEFHSVALGHNASAAGHASVALGRETSAAGYASVALGRETSAAGYASVALGGDARASENYSVALGCNAQATGDSSVALGYDASVARNYSTALGYGASAAETRSVALGYGASAENTNEGILGGTGISRTSKWKVPGSFTVSGTKNFEIPHPKPEKSATHVIRHGAVESPTPGDTLYRWRVQASKDNDLVTIDLPDYFVWLNTNVQIFVTPQGHFGNGYGDLNRETEQLEIHCQYEGEYNVLVIGTRNDDHQSVQDWHIKGVEREIGESWTGETYVFSVDEILEVEEIKEVSV